MMRLLPPGLCANSEQMKGKKVPTYITGLKNSGSPSLLTE